MDDETTSLERIADALERIADFADLLKLGFVMMFTQDPQFEPVLKVIANEHLHEDLLDNILAKHEVATIEELLGGQQ